MKVHIDTIPYTTKPKDSISIIKPRLQSNSTIKDVTLQELINLIKSGYSISPAIMSGGAKAENWTEQHLFMVDIDNDKATAPQLAPSEALAICKANNLQPSFYYYSFSHSEDKPKYRLCFVMDEVITDATTRVVIIEPLISLFPQSDTSCKNADRIFYGTNKDVVVCDLNACISLESVFNTYIPQKPQQRHTTDNKDDIELDRLKNEFDFFSYLTQRNGETLFNNSKCAMFKWCELCGHSKDLVFYHNTNTFNCFGAGCNRGGSIIDYLMLVNNFTVNEAINHLKYELLKLPKVEYSKEQKRDYAIKIQTPINNSLVEHLQELQPHKNYTLNDKGFGELFADIYKDYARYNVTAKEWYIYNGKVWIEDTGAMQISQKAKELADGLLIYATTIADEQQKQIFLNYVCKLGQFRYRETMIKDSRDKYFISQSDFDKELDLFNCENGTLNLKTFEFTTHNPNNLLSKISNVFYNPKATAPLFEKFIDDVMQGDKEKKEYLQKILGYALTADTSLETCFILYGATTRNGKSTLVETFSYMLGHTTGYALNMQPQTLAQKQNKDSRQASGDIARLNGCRFLNASEPPKRMIFDVALLKTLLGRDSITARHLHEREFEFKPYFKLFINTNFLPLITDDTLFSSGRLNVITFDRHFEPQEQDKTLKDRLRQKENISGVFNWCIDGLKMFYENGAEPPQIVTNSTNEYRSNSDKLGNFINECLEQTGNNSKALDVYITYKKWCELNGFGVENKGNFFDELRGKNLLSKTGTVNGQTIKNIMLGYEIIEDEQCLPEPPPYYTNKKPHNYY